MSKEKNTTVDRKNSFDLMRFLAASLVIASHSFALVGLREPHIGNTTLGGFSVWVFFILSGYLISASWKQYPRFNVFIAKRALRIFPGLVIALSITILALGLFSTLGYIDYILSQDTLSYLNNILLFNTRYSLPGVFTDNPFPNAVNGSIWTLVYEFIMYLSIGILGSLSLLKRNKVQYIWIGLLMLNILYVFSPKLLTFSIFYLDMRLVVQMGLMFYSGVLLQIYKNKIKYSWWSTSTAFILFFLISTLSPVMTAILGGTILAYSVLGIGSVGLFSFFGKYGDFSYGLYIYSFPVQQAVWHITKTNSPVKIFILSFIASCILGVLSWFLVESRFMKYKELIKKENYPLTDKHLELTRAW